MAKRERIKNWPGPRVATAVAATCALVLQACRPAPPVLLTGAVLLADNDPRKQSPIADANIAAVSAAGTASAKSDTSGLFRVTLPAKARGEKIAVTVLHPGYQPTHVTATGGELLVVRMPSSAPAMTALEKRVETLIANVRIRYSTKSTMSTNIGSVANTFEAANTGNVPCKASPPCSPDNQWKATISSYPLDAGPGHEFRNVRLSCIAGPCPFTRIESEERGQNGRTLKVTVRNWSDTTTFLLEAEVSQSQISDVIRQSYPAIFGSTMSFTLPAAAEGPSIEAEMNENDIVFPMGPDLIVSWANCSMTTSPNQGNLYRCELKAGYRFR